jgi:hypothetical protein
MTDQHGPLGRTDGRTSAARRVLATTIVPALAAGVLVAVHGTFSRAQPLALDEVLFRAGDRVMAYHKELANIVAEETYLQQILRPNGEVKRTRQLVSDFLLVNVPQDDLWMGFRDVFQVDGSPVGDRAERLQKLFLETPATAIGQARRIAREAARYNLGSVQRTINEPTLALVFLHPLNQYRFYFEKTGEDRIGETGVWVIGYTEHERPTLIRSGRGDVFARGRFWIDPVTGRAIRTELVAGDLNTTVRTRITVTYEPDSTMAIWVPARMEEEYDNPRVPGSDRITGRAIYSRFRKFQVKTDEKIAIPR